MKNKLKSVKLFMICAGASAFIACDGNVEFKAIEQAKNNGTNVVVEPPPGSQIVAGKQTVMQQSRGGSVDILIVVDNSVSMIDEQIKVGQRFGDFVSALNDVDWQIGFTTTDAREQYNSDRFGGRLLYLHDSNQRILNRHTLDLQHLFLKTINRERDQIFCDGSDAFPCGSNLEEPLKVTMQAIDRRHQENSGFFRQDAALAVLILSDEDEGSTGPSSATSASQVISKVRSVFGANKKFTTYGIVIQPGDTACFEQNRNDGGEYGDFVQQLAQATGGFTGSLCDSDYSKTLRAISQSVRKILMVSEVLLEHPPVAGSLKVQFSPAINAVKWQLKGQKVIFAEPPKEDTRIDVIYNYEVHE